MSDVSPLEAEVATLIVQTLTLKVDPAQIQPEEPLFSDGLGLDSIDALELSLAITAGLRIGMLSSTIHPYPTRSEAWKKLGDAWNRTRLTPQIRAISEKLMAWRR